MNDEDQSHLLLKYFHDPRFTCSPTSGSAISTGVHREMFHAWKVGIIIHLDSYYFEVESEYGAKAIPYHRICRITYRDEIVWSRNS